MRSKFKSLFNTIYCLKTKALSIKLREERGVEVFNFPDSEKNCTICPCVVMLRTRGLGLCEDGVGAHFCPDWLSLLLSLTIVCVGSVKCEHSQQSAAYLSIPWVHTSCKHCFSHAHPSSRDDDPISTSLLKTVIVPTWEYSSIWLLS